MSVKPEKTCNHCSFPDEDVFRFETFSKLDKDTECSLFRFYQKGKCYCFCVADMYQWIYGSLDFDEDIKVMTNPKTSRRIKLSTLQRLKREYEEYRKRLPQEGDISHKEKQEFLEGIDNFKAAFGSIGYLPPLKLVQMYLEDMQEILDPEEYERQIEISKVVMKERGWK